MKDHNLPYSSLISMECHEIGELIDCERFSKLQRLLRFMVYAKKIMLRFKSLITSNSTPVD